VGCCTQCQGIEREFDLSMARRDLRRLHRRGPPDTTRMLLEAILREGVGGATVLDIGGGVGTIHHRLLAAGASRAVHVDASPAYLTIAAEEARRLGHDGRVEFQHGDFVDLASEIAPADIVTLDRVVCCYPDMERLVARSAERAQRLYGLVFPRDRWLTAPLFPVANLYFRARRCPFRIFLHPPERIAAVVREFGLEPVFTGTTPVWRVALFARVSRRA
jgi:hypothetical protein